MKMSDFVVKCNDMIAKYGDLEVVILEFSEDGGGDWDLDFDVQDVNITLIPDPRDSHNAIFVVD